MLGRVLYLLTIVNIILMVVGPWWIYKNDNKPWLGIRALANWFGFFCAYTICNQLLRHWNGKFYAISADAYWIIIVMSWIAVVAGIGVVILVTRRSAKKKE